jgi:hypothetical protein
MQYRYRNLFADPYIAQISVSDENASAPATASAREILKTRQVGFGVGLSHLLVRNVELEEQTLAATLAPLERLVEFLFGL